MEKQLNFENARIGYKNFAGAEGPYNKSGDRNFVIFLEEQAARDLELQGWNVKYPKAREMKVDEEDTRQPYLPVSVSFKNFPPKVVLIAGDNVTKLQEAEVEVLDYTEIENVDLVVRPYNWSVNGQSGTKAYLKAIYVTMVTDAFTAKYGV